MCPKVKCQTQENFRGLVIYFIFHEKYNFLLANHNFFLMIKIIVSAYMFFLFAELKQHAPGALNDDGYENVYENIKSNVNKK